MKRKYVLAILVAIVLFLLYSRRVSGVPSCPMDQYYSIPHGICLQGSSTTTSTASVTKKQRR